VRPLYKNHINLITLYAYNSQLRKVVSYTRPYYKWVKKLPFHNVGKLIRGENNHLNGYYNSKKRCEEEHNNYTLYRYDEKLGYPVAITKKLSEWRSIFRGLTRGLLIHKKYTQLYGYYLDENKCGVGNDSITLYKYNIEHNTIMELLVKCKDLNSFLGSNYSKLFNGEAHQLRGWYVDKRKCIDDYRIIKVKHIETGIVKNVYWCNGLGEVGKNFQNLFRGVTKSCNGYELINEV
jgi:hypothetical protein